MTELLGAFISGVILTGMIQQLFPDGRFPISTTALVILAASVGAYVSQHYFAAFSLFTESFIGAGVVSFLLFYLFHSTGWLVLDVPTPPKEEPTETEKKD